MARKVPLNGTCAICKATVNKKEVKKHLQNCMKERGENQYFLPRFHPAPEVYLSILGKYLIRLGEGLRGMTLTEIDSIRREAGVEITAEPIQGEAFGSLSASGMGELRRLMKEAGASSDLIGLPG